MVPMSEIIDRVSELSYLSFRLSEKWAIRRVFGIEPHLID
jgi:hypothetical protein